MAISDKELGDAFQAIAEQLNAIQDSLSKLGAGLVAVKATLAVQMNPSSPLEASQHIDKLEAAFLTLDPNAPARKRVAEVIEMLKMIDKHGGPKQA